MKKFYYPLMLAVMAMCAACNDDDNTIVEPPIEPAEPIETNYEISAFYYGDYNDNGIGNFDLNLLTPGMTWDEDEATYLGNGELIYITFNSALAENPDNASLKPGSYTFADTYAEMTFADATITTYTPEGNETELSVTDGTLVVSITDGIYGIGGTVTLEDGTSRDINVVQQIKFINKSGEGQMSNIDGNITLSSFTQGLAILWGETFTDTSDYCSVIIAGPNYNLEENYGTSPAINLGLNLTPGSTEIPDGTYTVISSEEADDYDTFTMLSGVYEPTYGGYFGCWYFHGMTEGSLKSGTVDVARQANGQYKFTFDLADGYGHKVTGIWTGALEIYSE